MKVLNIILLLFVMGSGQAVAMDAQQYAVPSIQQQIEKRELTECQIKIRYYRDMKGDKKVGYYAFMYKLWLKRCIDQ